MPWHRRHDCIAALAVILGTGCGADETSTWRWSAPGDAATSDVEGDTTSPRDGAIESGDSGGLDTTTEPRVAFAEPDHGATIPNPVLFRVEASGVEEVEIFADGTWSLGPAWDPSVKDSLLYRFSGTGTARPIRLVGRIAGEQVAQEDITITIEPDACEDLFFVAQFDAHNEDSSGAIDLMALREGALEAIRSAVADMQACGAGVTLGGMMSLLLYEGGLRVAAFNTRCEENSYNPTGTDCDTDPEALYSYQFGLGAIHTSNFHPCKGGAYTQGMRQAFIDEAAAAGYDTSASLMTGVLESRFQQVCPGSESSAVDFFLLGAHDVFGIPRDGSGNHLDGYGSFPLFEPRVSIRLSFRELLGSCGSIVNDRDAIEIFGGNDSSYGDPAKQDDILALYESWAAANCPEQ